MKKTATIFTVILLISICSYAQYYYEQSDDFPYGQANPNAPQQIKDFQPLIGTCDCKSESRINGAWQEPVNIIWKWKYIMNGNGVQDETLKPNGSHTGNIRQFIADSSKWYVHYYSNLKPTTSLRTWEGKKNDDGKIILYRDQPSRNGLAGWYRLTFYNISEDGYDWIGEWVDKEEKIVFPTWKISCIKRKHNPNEEIESLLTILDNALIERDYNTLKKYYSKNLKLIAPNGMVLNRDQILEPFKDSSKKTKLKSISNTDLDITANARQATAITKTTHSFLDAKDRVYKNLMVFNKENGQWKLNAIYSNFIKK